MEVTSLFPSEFATIAFNYPDENGRLAPLSFDQRRYLVPVYDTPAKRILLKCGRKTEKSSTLGNKLLSYAYLRPFLQALYVTPTQQQTTVFSRDRLSTPMRTSSILRNIARGKDTADNILFKQFNNFSTLTLRYAYHNADSSRGLVTDLLVLDELQDILWDNIAILEECMAHSHLKLATYSGTPKSFDNALEYLWQRFSTQFEWAIPCDACGSSSTYRHWNIVDYDNIGPKGLCCSRCFRLISPMHADACWASMRDEAWLKDPPNSVGIPFEGYRIPQPIVSWLSWPEVLDKKARYSTAQFHNEVLGLSYESGEKIVRKQALIDSSRAHITLNNLDCVKGKGPLFMGIDWGGGSEVSSANSFTDVVIGGYAGDMLVVPFFKRYQGRDAEEERMMADIFSLIDEHRVHLIGCDYGGGHVYNDKLIRRYGAKKVFRFQYCSTKKLYFDSSLLRFMVNRTEALMALVNAINRMTVFEFPRWEQWEHPFADCFLTLHIEYDESGRTTTISKTPGTSDDSVHALVACLLASMVVHPRPDILTPDKEK